MVIPPDTINGLFEALAGLFVLNHCRVLYDHKKTRGVSLISAAFFTAWGFWNLYYYPALNQPISFYGGMFVVAANAIYIGMMAWYRRAETNATERVAALYRRHGRNGLANFRAEILKGKP